MPTIEQNSKTRSIKRQQEHLRNEVEPIWNGVWAWLGIDTACISQWIEKEMGCWRERRYAPLTTLMMFIGQAVSADRSCQDAVAREAAQTQRPVGQNTGPYCRARQRLSLKLIQHLGFEVGERLCATQREAWRWRGREVKLIDGTTVSMPDTEANQRRFPQSRTQKPGIGFPVARLVAIMSLSCGAVLKWTVGACEGKSSGETSMLRELAHCFQAGDLVMADRYYAGYITLATLIDRGTDIITRQHQKCKTDFRRGKRLGKYDHIVEWPKPVRPRWMDADAYAALPDCLVLREVRIANWVVVTSLLDADEVSRLELNSLYVQRWQIEVNLRSIKWVMQMGVLRCMTPDMVEKEIAVHLLSYNLICAAIAQAAAISDVHPRQISFKASLQLLRAFDSDRGHCPGAQPGHRHDILFDLLACKLLSKRPGRVEPRVKKRRPSNYPLMTKTRDKLKNNLKKQKDKIDTALR